MSKTPTLKPLPPSTKQPNKILNKMNKQQKINFAVIVFTTFMAFGIIAMAAESNYNKAIFYSQHTDGSDAEIEQAMYEHGFIVDAYSSEEPTMIEKIVALTR